MASSSLQTMNTPIRIPSPPLYMEFYSSDILSSFGSVISTSQQSQATKQKYYKNTCNLNENKKLLYTIDQYSSYSVNYKPENILVDCPNDQSSRWSSFNNNPPQYLILKLRRVAVLRAIKFGKFEISHVCNIKEFRIYGGLHGPDEVLLLESSLDNDNIPEIFYLPSKGLFTPPILYLKIVPLSSWGSTFNYSIWYIELLGEDDPTYTTSYLRDLNKFKEIQIVRLCLKHFRQRGYNAAFKALQGQTEIQLEDPKFTLLHECLVNNGDFEKSEQIITQYVQDGLMDEYLNSQDYKHAWRKQFIPAHQHPGSRGGHQLVVDTEKSLIYLFGGWNGYKDLSDLWVYDINNNSWTQLFEHSEHFNGPTPRSCHKMVFDPVFKNIFILGRYIANSIRKTDYIKSDFFLYDTLEKKWLQICDDTSQVSGPQLIYDHQMCIDVDKHTIYVFGGKILTPYNVNASTMEPEYSGLFSYHIPTNTWSHILVDSQHPSAFLRGVSSIDSRITHCMVFHNKNRKLYIYGGQRGKEDIHDFITYDVDGGYIEPIHKNSTFNDKADDKNCLQNSLKKINEPSPYGLRATIDCERNEIYIFSSLGKIKYRHDVQTLPNISNSFWVYNIENNTWTKIYSCRYNYTNSTAINEENKMNDNLNEPCPRYAHQLVYDDHAKVHYLFGGNPGFYALPQHRLDDFWILDLYKPSREEILMECRYLLRVLQYEELTQSDFLKAIQYLRTNVAEVIDHNNKEQLQKFHKLASLLFQTENDVCYPNITISPLSKKEDNTSDYSQSTAANVSVESAESTTSGISDADTFYSAYQKLGGKLGREDFIANLRSKRSFLFNKLVQFMLTSLVQPKHDLIDMYSLPDF